MDPGDLPQLHLITLPRASYRVASHEPRQSPFLPMYSSLPHRQTKMPTAATLFPVFAGMRNKDIIIEDSCHHSLNTENGNFENHHQPSALPASFRVPNKSKVEGEREGGRMSGPEHVRPMARDLALDALWDRAALEPIVSILRTGILWEILPAKQFGLAGIAAWRRLEQWTHTRVFEQLRAAIESSRLASRPESKKALPGPSVREKRIVRGGASRRLRRRG
jgi:hypothetical protein